MKILFSYAERMLVSEGLAELPLKVSLSLHNYFTEIGESDKRDYEFDFSRQDLDLIVAALGTLTANRSYHMIRKIDEQLLIEEVQHGHAQRTEVQRDYERGDTGSSLGSGSESGAGEDIP